MTKKMQGFNLKVMNITRLASETMRLACLAVWCLVSFRRFACFLALFFTGLLVFFLTGFSSVHYPPCTGAGGSQLHFTSVTLKAGIHFQHEDGRSGEKYFLETLGAGAAWFDYDRDGDLDIYFVNGRDLPGMQSKIPPTNALYRNNGDGTFTDVTEIAFLEGDGYYGFSCAAGDYDNDGWEDLYVANFGHSILYHNNGDGTFADVTDRAGVGNDGRWAAAAAFADYNNDGELDLFVANYVDYRLKENPVCGKGVRLHCSPNVFEGKESVLYRNNGDGTFTSVTRQSGLDKIGKGMGVIWCDYDNDGDMDLFVANDRMPNYLYRNNGDGTFTDVALQVGIAISEMGVAQSNMAPIFGDIDNDGWLDLVIANFENEPNNVYHNDGNGFFSDDTYKSGVGGHGLSYISWGADMADFDNDGYIDLVIANGHLDDNIQEANPSITYAQPNQLFRNNGDGTFEDVSECLLLKKVSRGVALGDYDNDGDIDILVTNVRQTPDLLRNDSVNKNHWLIFETVGTRSNRDGIGARIKVVAKGLSQIRFVKSGGSYPSHSDMRLHFGLGKAAVADFVEIRWPSGLVERFNGVRANQFLRAKEGEGLSTVQSPSSGFK